MLLLIAPNTSATKIVLLPKRPYEAKSRSSFFLTRPTLKKVFPLKSSAALALKKSSAPAPNTHKVSKIPLMFLPIYSQLKLNAKKPMLFAYHLLAALTLVKVTCLTPLLVSSKRLLPILPAPPATLTAFH